MLKHIFSLIFVCVIFFSLSSFSFSQSLTLSATAFSYRGDLTEDGQVNIFDLLALLRILGGEPGTDRQREIANVDKSENGKVDIFDLLALLKVLGGNQDPDVIYWGPAIRSLSSNKAAAGDTLIVTVENFGEDVTQSDVFAYFGDMQVDILCFSLEEISVLAPEDFVGGNVWLVVKDDTTNYVYCQGIPIKSYHITNSAIVNNADSRLERLILILPLAQTNNYQEVNNIQATGAEIINIPETDDKYARYTITGSDLPSQGDSKQWGYEFDVTLHSINMDLDQISTIYPYDTSANIYQWYTGASGEIVDPNNLTIQSTGDSLWSHSSDLLDYAQRCYEYVAQSFQYLNPGTGLRPLSELLTDGGGDCGNLSSIYISLLRFKNIPSRHIVTVRPDGSYHVWADFYMENYEWIPVDVTYKLGNPNGDYFGKYDGNGIVFSKEVWLILQRDNDYSYRCSLLQTFNWWWWGTGGGNISVIHSLNSKPN